VQRAHERIVGRVLHHEHVDLRTTFVVTVILATAHHGALAADAREPELVALGVLGGVQPVAVAQRGVERGAHALVRRARHSNIHIVIPGNEPAMAHRSQAAAAEQEPLDVAHLEPGRHVHEHVEQHVLQPLEGLALDDRHAVLVSQALERLAGRQTRHASPLPRLPPLERAAAAHDDHDGSQQDL